MFSIWRTFSDVMRPTSPWVRVAFRRVCEASALVVLALMLSSRCAQASCGDYVHVEGRSANHVGDMAAVAWHGAPANRESGSPVCQGPHCRRQRPPRRA